MAFKRKLAGKRAANSEPKVYDARKVRRTTPSVLGDEFIEQLHKTVSRRVEREGADKKEFITRFDDNPAYALEWGNDVFQLAGRIKVAKDILAWIMAANERQVDEYTLVSNINLVKHLKDYLLREVINGARWPASSTSVPSNLMARYVLSAQAEVLEDLRGWFNFYSNELE